MDYVLKRNECKISAIDERGKQHKIDSVLEFNESKLLYIIVEQDSKLNIAGYFNLLTKSKELINPFPKDSSCMVVDSSGTIIYEGAFITFNIEIFKVKNNWFLISVFYHQENAMLFNAEGCCIKYFENVRIYDSYIKDDWVNIEGIYKSIDSVYGKSKSSIDIWYRVDFAQHRIYEFEEIPDCSRLGFVIGGGLYYKCTILHINNIIESNIAIGRSCADSFKILYESPIEVIKDIYHSEDCLLALVKLKKSEDLVYTYCCPNNVHGGFNIHSKKIDKRYQFKRLKKEYANLIITSPLMQFTNDKGERFLYHNTNMIAQSKDDFHLLHDFNGFAKNDYMHVMRHTVRNIDEDMYHMYYCSGNKIYDINGNVVNVIGNSGKQPYFRILDTWNNCIAGHYVGTGHYDFFLFEYREAKLVVEQAGCHIQKVNNNILVSLQTNKHGFWLDTGSYFDITQDIFVIHPKFRPQPKPQNDLEFEDDDYDILNDAFEGEVDLYNEWLNS